MTPQTQIIGQDLNDLDHSIGSVRKSSLGLNLNGTEKKPIILADCRLQSMEMDDLDAFPTIIPKQDPPKPKLIDM